MAVKKTGYEIVSVDHDAYASLREAREFHPDLVGAHIALAWRIRQRADKDGLLQIGKCVKVPDLQKEFAAWDFIIVLNQPVFIEFDSQQRVSLIDHELCHARPRLDEKELQLKDDRGRLVWRYRRHDIEEFREVIERHGCYKADLVELARAIFESNPSLALEFPVEDPPGAGRIELPQ